MKKQRKIKIISIVLAIVMLTGLSVKTIYNYLKKYDFNQLISNEFDDKDYNALLDDMLIKDEKEIEINDFQKYETREIATGEELIKYLEENDIKFFFINGRCFTKNEEEIIVPSSIYDENVFFLKDDENFFFSDSDKEYTIISTSYEELEKYNINKLVAVNDQFKDNDEYCERYSLAER